MKLTRIILYLLIASPVLLAAAKFPSNSKIRSPDGKWTIACESPSDASGHTLLLSPARGETIALHRFDRHVDAVWSPDSLRLAVTDWLGSDTSDVFIYTLTNLTHAVTVRQMLPRWAISDAELRGHCYFTATKWMDAHRLKVRVTGHTDEPPLRSIDRILIVDLASGRVDTEP
jgi:hypothetical protein